MARRLISTKEIANRFNISYQTINYYTNLGLLEVIDRKGNKRLYDEQIVGEHLDKIHRFKVEGYPLRLIFKIIKKK